MKGMVQSWALSSASTSFDRTEMTMSLYGLMLFNLMLYSWLIITLVQLLLMIRL